MKTKIIITAAPSKYELYTKLRTTNILFFFALRMFVIFSYFGGVAVAQNTGISTDGTLPETGVMLDVKGTTDKTVTATSTLFQVKSFNTSTNELKMRLILHSDAAGVASRYGQIDVADYTSGTPTYVNLLFQPAGGNVGIGTTSPNTLLHIKGSGTDQIKAESTGASAGIILVNSSGQTGEFKTNATDAILNAPLAGGNLQLTTQGVSTQGIFIKAGGNVGIGTVTPNTLFDVNGSIAYREGTALTLANGANNDIALGAFSYFRITGPTAAFTVSGFTGGVDGRIVTVYNTTTQIMTISNDALSTAANRIYTLKGADIVTPAGPNVVQLQYNANVSRWLVIGGQNLTSSGSSGAGSWLVYTIDGF